MPVIFDKIKGRPVRISTVEAKTYRELSINPPSLIEELRQIAFDKQLWISNKDLRRKEKIAAQAKERANLFIEALFSKVLKNIKIAAEGGNYYYYYKLPFLYRLFNSKRVQNILLDSLQEKFHELQFWTRRNEKIITIYWDHQQYLNGSY